MAPSADPRLLYTVEGSAEACGNAIQPLQRVSCRTMRRIRVRGVLVSSDTVRLHQPLLLPDGSEVEVLIEEPHPRGSLPLMLATLEAIHARLEAAGYCPPTPEEVRASIE